MNKIKSKRRNLFEIYTVYNNQLFNIVTNAWEEVGNIDNKVILEGEVMQKDLRRLSVGVVAIMSVVAGHSALKHSQP